jgi:hypothetical protein
VAEVDDERPPGRRVRLAAAAIDAAVLLVLLTGTLIVALAYLLARTAWGRFDVGLGDALVAASLLGAGVPAWAAWQLARLQLEGATLGQRRLGLAVEARAPWRRLARFAAHPLAVPVWGWLALTALIAGLPWLPLLPALAGGLVLLAGLVSLAMLAVDPDARGLHDRLAGTRLVRAR